MTAWEKCHWNLRKSHKISQEYVGGEVAEKNAGGVSEKIKICEGGSAKKIKYVGGGGRRRHSAPLSGFQMEQP